MTKIIFTGATLFCIFFLTGCATIMSHGPQTIPILTQPDGAECEITDVAAGKNIVKAKTPHTATLERGDGYFQKKYYNITLSKDGYVTEKVSITPELNPWYIANLLFGGIPGMLIVDPLTGSMWRFEEKEISVKLYQDTTEGRAARMVDEQARTEAKAKEQAQREKQIPSR
ncbi:MAG: hypothetical protein ACYC6Q_03245 [Syntrophales bacterium]